MKIHKVRKKPVEVEAVLYTGNYDYELANWCGGKLVAIGQGFWNIAIPTLEGVVSASPGDWIICGVAGEFYPCKPRIFADTYERVL